MAIAVAARNAMLAKIEWVLDIAATDEGYRRKLEENAFATLTYGGVDLSGGEILALVDIINDREESPLNPHLEPLRERWRGMATGGTDVPEA